MDVNLHVDLETLQLIQGPGQRSAFASLRFKRGDAARLRVVFLENGFTPVPIGDPDELEIQIGIKPRNQFDHSYLAHNADWSMPAEGDDTPTYECELSLNTLQLNSALNVGSATAEELPEITLMGEITWREGNGEPTSTRTFLVVVENDVNRGTEGAPTDANPGNITLTGTIAASNLSGTNTGDNSPNSTSATAAQGDLADSALQPVPVDYRGAYNNGDATYGIGSVVLYDALLYRKISNPNNAGYPPTGTDWELFEPLIGSPAYDLWVQTLLDSKANNQDLADYLPLAGGTMDVGADIIFANGSAIREAGTAGLELECSVGYRWQWVEGRMIMRQINSEQIARILAIDGSAPTSTNDLTEGFVPGTRWETANGTVYVCTNSSENAAVWVVDNLQLREVANRFSADHTEWNVGDLIRQPSGAPRIAQIAVPIDLVAGYYGMRFIDESANSAFVRTFFAANADELANQIGQSMLDASINAYVDISINVVTLTSYTNGALPTTGGVNGDGAWFFEDYVPSGATMEVTQQDEDATTRVATLTVPPALAAGYYSGRFVDHDYHWAYVTGEYTDANDLAANFVSTLNNSVDVSAAQTGNVIEITSNTQGGLTQSWAFQDYINSGSVLTVVQEGAGSLPRIATITVPTTAQPYDSYLFDFYDDQGNQYGTGPAICAGYTEIVSAIEDLLSNFSTTLGVSVADNVITVTNNTPGELAGPWQLREPQPSGITLSAPSVEGVNGRPRQATISIPENIAGYYAITLQDEYGFEAGILYEYGTTSDILNQMESSINSFLNVTATQDGTPGRLFLESRSISALPYPWQLKEATSSGSVLTLLEMDSDPGSFIVADLDSPAQVSGYEQVSQDLTALETDVETAQAAADAAYNMAYNALNAASGAVPANNNTTINGIKTFTSFPVIPTTTPNTNNPVSKTYLDTQITKVPYTGIVTAASQTGTTVNVTSVAPNTWRFENAANSASNLVFRLNNAASTNWRTGAYGYWAVNYAIRITAVFGHSEGHVNRVMEWYAVGVAHTSSPLRIVEVRNVTAGTGTACPITACTITQEVVSGGKLDIIFTCTMGSSNRAAGLITVERL